MRYLLLLAWLVTYFTLVSNDTLRISEIPAWDTAISQEDMENLQAVQKIDASLYYHPDLLPNRTVQSEAIERELLKLS